MPLHYAVLASVSGRYSPLEGRLLTCYSPVRHFMHSPKRALIVRLACLRHAASVDSEPGSNSQVKGFVRSRPCGRLRASPKPEELVALLFVTSCVLAPPLSLALERRLPGCHSTGWFLKSASALACARAFADCVHVLSSFQRTEAGPSCVRVPRARSLSRPPRSGEPSKLTSASFLPSRLFSS